MNCGGLKNSFRAFLALVTLVFSVTVVLGQGTVIFANNVAFGTPADRLVRDMNGVPLVGTNYSAQLYYGALGASEMDLVSVSDLPARFRSSATTQPGTWFEGDSRYRTLDGFPPGENVSLQVRVWDSFAGLTWEQAAGVNFAGTQYGSSAVFGYYIPVVCGNNPFCYTMDNLRGFMLVPEPSVIALAVLGVGGFLLLRRRK